MKASDKSVPLWQEFLAQVQFTSDNVRQYLSIELGLTSEDDLKQHEPALKELIQTFTPQEYVEYLTVVHLWYQCKYSNYPLALRLTRLHELSELSMRVPIDLIQPVRYIEYMTLAATIPTLQLVMQNFTPISDYIAQFVAKITAKPQAPTKGKGKKPKTVTNFVQGTT